MRPILSWLLVLPVLLFATGSFADQTNMIRLGPGFTPDGDYETGRSLFYGDKLKCGTCHRIRETGGGIGPDLSDLVHREAASVLRDIQEPSAKINPGYVGQIIKLRNGEELAGFVRSQTANSLRVLGADGMERVIPAAEVKDMQSSNKSLMPAGLIDGAKPEEIRDLLTFLLSGPPHRTRAEVDKVLAAASRDDLNPVVRPLNVVLVASKQDHGPGQHDYPAWQKRWLALLGGIPKVTVTHAWEWPSPDQFRGADVIMLYCWNHDWSVGRYAQLDAFLARGGGLVALHAATIADHEPEQLAARLGLAAQPGPTKYQHTPFELKFTASANNMITRGLPQLNLLDEPYWPMIGATNEVEVLATAEREGLACPMVWTFQKGKGRVFATVLGHYTWTWEDPLFRLLVWRGLAWTAGEPVGRFDALAASLP